MIQTLTKPKPMPTNTEPKEAYINIREYWPKQPDGSDRSLNSIIDEYRDTDLQLSPSTLRLARDGNLSRTLVKSLPILVTLCSKWSGKKVKLEDIIKINE